MTSRKPLRNICLKEVVSDRDERFFVSELVREEIFKAFKEEVPYSTTVEIEEFRESDNERKTYIRAVIYVEKNSQKGIIIGRNGLALKGVGQCSRKQIEEMIGHEVFLELFVKVKDGWRNNKKTLSQLGYR
jgi:GTP-binding protein Era